MPTKPKWNCTKIERIYKKIQSTEMRQRLAEVLETLLQNISQLQEVPAFSKDYSLLPKPYSKQRRAGHEKF